MDRVSVLKILGKDIISVDYSGCKAEQMIEIFNQAKEIIENSNGGCLILANFERTFVTPSFMRHAEKEILQVRHLISRNAFINLSRPQLMILKGFRLFIGKDDFLSFGSYQEAIDYLIGDDAKP
ncbi:MAG: hypothetical protein QM734_16765 [Cyclobacteriaceae bacterium]